MRRLRARVEWALIVLVVAVALVVGAARPASSNDNESRARSLAAEVKCPTCRSQSALESDAPAARAIRVEIARRVESGESDGEIREFLLSRYGDEIVLRPPSRGAGLVVWLAPLAAALGGVVVVAAAVRRWQRWAR